MTWNLFSGHYTYFCSIMQYTRINFAASQGWRVVSGSQAFSSLNASRRRVMGELSELANEWTRTARAQHPWHGGQKQNGHGCPFCNFLPRDTKLFYINSIEGSKILKLILLRPQLFELFPIILSLKGVIKKSWL